jgi:hypothetical protein
MNPLKSVETMIANLVEGTFGRVFRAEVRPMELARKLAREMDAHRTVSLSRVYVPNEYSVWLSLRDRERYEGVEHEVIDELCSYLLEHARREQLIMASSPHISFHTDERLSLGEFGIQARLARSDAEDDQSHPEPRQEPVAPRAARALLAFEGRRLIVPAGGATIGRSRECDVVLDDAGISRRHAQLTPGPQGWLVEDLGSTNGVRVNGEPLRGARPLTPGDRVELGSTEVVFEVS